MVFFRRKKPQSESTQETPTPSPDTPVTSGSPEGAAVQAPDRDVSSNARTQQQPSHQQRPRRLNPLAMQDPRDIPGNIVSTLRRDQPQRPARNESDGPSRQSPRHESRSRSSQRPADRSPRPQHAPPGG